MKKIVIALIAIFVISAIVAVGAQAINDHYQINKKTPVAVISQSESDKKLADAKATAVAEYNALIDRFNQQAIECQKGKIAYDKLPISARAQTPSPLCAPGIDVPQ